MPHGRHIYSKSFNMVKAAMCAYPQSDHALPHWKCVLRCCSYFPCINLHDQETDNQCSDKTLSIRFHIYHIIVRFTAHGRIPLKYKKICCMYICKNIHQKRASYVGDNNFWFSCQFPYTSHKRVGLSPTTCAHTWYKSLW